VTLDLARHSVVVRGNAGNWFSELCKSLTVGNCIRKGIMEIRRRKILKKISFAIVGAIIVGGIFLLGNTGIAAILGAALGAGIGWIVAV